MRELFAYDRIGDVDAELVEVNAAELDRFSLNENDLLFARQSLTFAGAGKVSIIDRSERPRVFESHILRARPDASQVDAHYLYYYFSRGPGRRDIEAIIQQVAAAGVRSSELSNLPVALPEKGKQQAVAEVLRALDDKIAANLRLTVSSESLLHALFERLPTAGFMKLGDISSDVRESVSIELIDPDSIYVGLEHLDSRTLWVHRSGLGSDVRSTKSVFTSGDTLFGRLRPYFHKVAYPGVAGICSTDILVIRPKLKEAAWVVAACASSDATVSLAVQNSNGTKMPRAKWADISSVSVPDPSSVAAKRFSRDAEIISDRCLAAVAESKRLATARDQLLPLLMDGRVTVKDAEKRVEEEV